MHVVFFFFFFPSSLNSCKAYLFIYFPKNIIWWILSFSTEILFSNYSEPNFEHEFNHFLRGREGILPGQPTIHVPGLNPDQLEGATALSKLPAFKNLQKNLDNIEV